MFHPPVFCEDLSPCPYLTSHREAFIKISLARIFQRVEAAGLSRCHPVSGSKAFVTITLSTRPHYNRNNPMHIMQKNGLMPVLLLFRLL